MNLIRGEVRRGIICQARLIFGRAVRETPDPVVTACPRLLRLHRRDNPLVGRLEIPNHRGAARGEQPVLRRPVCLQLFDLGLEVRPQVVVRAAVERRAADEVAAVVDDIWVDPARGEHAQRRACPGFRDCLIEVPRDGADPGDIGLRIADAVHLVDVDQESGAVALRAVHLIEHEPVFPIRPQRIGTRDAIQEEVVAELVFRAEAVPGKAALQLGGVALIERAILFRGRIRELVPLAIVRVLDAAISLGDRREREFRLVIVVEERSQFRVPGRGLGHDERRGLHFAHGCRCR